MQHIFFLVFLEIFRISTILFNVSFFEAEGGRIDFIEKEPIVVLQIRVLIVTFDWTKRLGLLSVVPFPLGDVHILSESHALLLRRNNIALGVRQFTVREVTGFLDTWVVGLVVLIAWACWFWVWAVRGRGVFFHDAWTGWVGVLVEVREVHRLVLTLIYWVLFVHIYLVYNIAFQAFLSKRFFNGVHLLLHSVVEHSFDIFCWSIVR